MMVKLPLLHVGSKSFAAWLTCRSICHLDQRCHQKQKAKEKKKRTEQLIFGLYKFGRYSYGPISPSLYVRTTASRDVVLVLSKGLEGKTPNANQKMQRMASSARETLLVDMYHIHTEKGPLS